MHRIARTLLLLISLLVIGSPVVPPGARYGVTQAEAPKPSILLQAAQFVPSEADALSAQPQTGAELAQATGETQYLVQYEGPILEDWRVTLEQTGARILNYVPEFAYRVRADPQTASRLETLPGVLWVGVYRPEYRVGVQLQSADVQRLRVEFADPVDEALVGTVRALGAEVIGYEGRTASVDAGGDVLAALSRLPSVEWIGPLSMPRLHNDVAAATITAITTWPQGYTGRGQIVCVADSGIDTGRDQPHINGDIHLDLDNRVDHISSWPISPLYDAEVNNPGANDGAADVASGHGTHVAGSVAGNGARSGGLYRGMAHGARLTVQALEQWVRWRSGTQGYYLAGVPADLQNLYQEAYDWGARIHSNSWGETGGAYDVWSQQTDQFVWDHRDMLILFATGNGGQDADGDGLVDYGSVSPPATAKNIIAVGAVENMRPALTLTYGSAFPGLFPALPIRDDPMADAGPNGMMATSGRGPTQDQRYAPHLVAPGTWIASTRSSQTSAPGWGAISPYYVYNGGTSMSTPLVAGAAALVRQAYQDRGHTPSAALLKATLIQSARNIPGQYPAPHGDAGPIPNNDEGWGVVDLGAAVRIGRRYADELHPLRTGEQVSFTYATSGFDLPIKFTLVWTDYPGHPANLIQLVNDLDLEVVAPDGQVYRGNHFAGGWSRNGGAADRRNNVENVYLPSSLTGTYTVRVRGYNVPFGPQPFALLVDVPGVATHRAFLPTVYSNR